MDLIKWVIKKPERQHQATSPAFVFFIYKPVTDQIE